MSLKKYLEAIIRGWLPKEPNLPIYKRTMSQKTWHTWFVALLIIGAFVGGFLGALGYFLGLTSGFGLYAWSTLIGIVIGTVVAVVSVRLKRKEEEQRMPGS